MQVISLMIGVFVGILAYYLFSYLKLIITPILKGVRLLPELKYLFFNHFIGVYFERKINNKEYQYRYWISEERDFHDNFTGAWKINIWKYSNNEMVGNLWYYFDINDKEENKKSCVKVQEIIKNGF